MATYRQLAESLRRVVANVMSQSAALARMMGARVDADGYVYTEGRAVVLHFDLDTSSGKRSAVYKLVEDAAKALDAEHLGGSIYLFPVGYAESTQRQAVGIWNAVQKATVGELRDGDTFFVQFATESGGALGNIAQTVQEGSRSLHSVEMPRPLNG